MDGRSKYLWKTFRGDAHISAKAMTSPVIEATGLFEEGDTAEPSAGGGRSGSSLALFLGATKHDARLAQPFCWREGRASIRSEFPAKNQLHDATTGILGFCVVGVNEPWPALTASWRAGRGPRMAGLRVRAAPGEPSRPQVWPSGFYANILGGCSFNGVASTR